MGCNIIYAPENIINRILSYPMVFNSQLKKHIEHIFDKLYYKHGYLFIPGEELAFFVRDCSEEIF